MVYNEGPFRNETVFKAIGLQGLVDTFCPPSAHQEPNHGPHGPHALGPRAQGQPPKITPTQPAALGPWAHGAHGTHRVIQMGPGQTGPGLIDSQMALALPIASFQSN